MQFFIVFSTFCLALTTAVSTVDILKYFQDPEQHRNVPPRVSTDQRIAKHDYPVETHKVVTEDGYILGVFRIPYSHKLQNQNATRPIVLLQHGLISSSDIWVLNGPNDGLPFLLADAGFDVWIANSRGNAYSRNHTKISLKHPSFWRFSWHEMGYFDLPAMLDYALATNGQSQKAIHYVGHSQGTAALFVFLSTRPEYNAKIKTAHMLAPIGYMSNMRDPLVNILAPYLGYHNKYSLLFGSQEFLPQNELFVALRYKYCAAESKYPKLCSAIAYLVQGSESNTNQTALSYMIETHPAGASTDQVCHFFQEHQSGYFRKFDFGRRKNLAAYGQELPPDYAVELITANLHLWYSDNDDLAAVEDVEKIALRLPNKVMHHIEDPLWTHGNFVLAIKVRETINDPIINLMCEYESQRT